MAFLFEREGGETKRAGVRTFTQLLTAYLSWHLRINIFFCSSGQVPMLAEYSVDWVKKLSSWR